MWVTRTAIWNMRLRPTDGICWMMGMGYMVEERVSSNDAKLVESMVIAPYLLPGCKTNACLR